jgi:predicted ATPase
MPYYITLLATACEIAEQTKEALILLDDALKIVERTGERWLEAELHRQKANCFCGKGIPTKALAFRDAGKMPEAREWAAELVTLAKTKTWRRWRLTALRQAKPARWGRCTICSKLHAKQHQCIVARVRRFGAKVAASFVSHATAPDVRCHAAPHSVT